MRLARRASYKMLSAATFLFTYGFGGCLRSVCIFCCCCCYGVGCSGIVFFSRCLFAYTVPFVFWAVCALCVLFSNRAKYHTRNCGDDGFEFSLVGLNILLLCDPNKTSACAARPTIHSPYEFDLCNLIVYLLLYDRLNGSNGENFQLPFAVFSRQHLCQFSHFRYIFFFLFNVVLVYFFSTASVWFSDGDRLCMEYAIFTVRMPFGSRWEEENVESDILGRSGAAKRTTWLFYKNRAIYFIFIYCSRVKVHSKINISIMYTKRKANDVSGAKNVMRRHFLYLECMQNNNLKWMRAGGGAPPTTTKQIKK